MSENKSKISFESIVLPAASLNAENPFPDIAKSQDIHSNIRFHSSISQNERWDLDYGQVSGILPYRIQDDYDRVKKPTEIPVTVLENDYVKAMFMPQYGGKLYSLYDKEHNKELLHANPVFQPANLALRNAWTSGGVEWNFGITGHTPYTLSPLHTAVLNMSDGTPVLRMYEFERVRRVTYQIDAYLPENSHFLMVRIHLKNTQNEETPIYWWSNIAVEETEDTRVLAPAPKAFKFGYENGMVAKIEMPYIDEIDHSYTTRVKRSLDLFFDIPKDNRKWEAALNGDGNGLIQASTSRLDGRKLFMWGTGTGGKNWQEFLSQKGRGYIEIQAGIAKTQMERKPMAANSTVEWLEAYGYIETDKEKVHGEWTKAYTCVQEELDSILPADFLENELKRLEKELAKKGELKYTASGWGALELCRTGRETCFDGEYAEFPKTSIVTEKPWLSLLENGILPCSEPLDIPAEYQTQAEWLALLENSLRQGKNDDWHGHYQLGVQYAANKMPQKAREEFEKSLAKAENPWALRCIAKLDLAENMSSCAADKMTKAFNMLKVKPLARECGDALLEACRYEDFLNFYDGLPEKLKKWPRIQFQLANARIELNDFEPIKEFLNSDARLIDDMREGESLFSTLWTKLYSRESAYIKGVSCSEEITEEALEKHPIPEVFDYRMMVKKK